MKQEKFSIPIEVYQDESELQETDRRLLAHAEQQVSKAYAPYSHFKVGVALLLANGEVVTGNNVENAAYPMCLCAEQAAIGAASARFPDVAVVSLAVTVFHEKKVIDQPAGPCGSCRQVISEMEDRHQQSISIIMRGTTGPVYKVRSAKDLLPISFSGAFL
ncbi:MAG: cytidine deaminase [Saprospiraceae bacterium]|nr:cytidine deaminase [Lewinella sp.]